MSSETARNVAVALVILLTDLTSAWAGAKVAFDKSLTISDRQCMADMLQTGKWRFSPELHRQMIEAAVVARADLKVKEQRQYIFMITDFGFCGTAGCAMLIGEIHEDGNCHEIYDGSGFKHATEILGRRDHGYRRLYTPCELRFDGHEYRQIRDECPNPDVQR